MNTCAECRFWDRNCSDFVRQGAGGDFSLCRLASKELTPESRVMLNGGLITRSDFGCVQFEEVKFDDPASMRCGKCHAIWNPSTQKHYCPGVVRDISSGIQVGYTFTTTNGEQ